jgi:hypothetical protein
MVPQSQVMLVQAPQGDWMQQQIMLARQQQQQHAAQMQMQIPSREDPPPPTELQPPPPSEEVDAKTLFQLPGRRGRPPKLAIILRGLPGAGKSRLVRQLKDYEGRFGVSPPLTCKI